MFKKVLTIAQNNKWHIVAIILVCLWSLPMLLTWDKIERGDFSYFSQIYEAIRVSIVDYHQFPWWNPWIGGGVPLYANPQAGVFSLTTLLTLIFPTPFALKLTVFIFYILGYLSIVKLLRVLRVSGIITTLLGLIWVLNGYFVAHLPAHFTFIWLLVMPWYIAKALELNSFKDGVLLGLGLTALALGQAHYSLIMISFAVFGILGVRLLSNKATRIKIIHASITAFSVFTVLSLHRLIMTLYVTNSQSVSALDPPSRAVESILSFLIPHSYNFGWVASTTQPFYGWSEQTAYTSIFIVFAFLASLVMIATLTLTKHKNSLIKAWQDDAFIRKVFLILILVITSFAIGVGDKFGAAPYSILKELPIFDSMRISSRWFIFTVLTILLFIGTTYESKKSSHYHKNLVTVLCVLAIFELFALNFSYHSKLLSHPVSKPESESKLMTFGQYIRFGESATTPDGLDIPGADKQYLYREYESTLFNIGTIVANEAHANLYENETPRCSYVVGCGLVLSKNARITYWSPNKIILERTSQGPIELNISPTNYILVNGNRIDENRAVHRKGKTIINNIESEKTLVIIYNPTLF